MSSDNTPETGATRELETERSLQQQLEAGFSDLSGKVTIQRVRRVWAEVAMDKLHEVLLYAKDQLGFGMLCTITGTDEGSHLGLMYHLANNDGVVLTLVTAAPKDGPGPQTVTAYFPHADLYERELVDLLGVRIQGMAEGSRYPLHDGWPEGQYPLRKDWTQDMLEVGKENGQ